MNCKIMIGEKARQIRENDLSTIQQRLMNIINDYNQRATILMERRENDLEKRNSYHNQIHDLLQQVIFHIKYCQKEVVLI